MLPRESRVCLFIGLSLVLACGSSAPPKARPTPPPTASATPAPGPSAELLTAQALQILANLGEQHARPSLVRALDAWKRESGQPARWFETGRGASSLAALQDSKVALDPTGRWLARSERNEITVFDTSTWLRERVFEHGGHVRSLAFDSRGTRLWSSATDGTVSLWDIPRAKLLHTAKDNREVDQLLTSPDGARIVYRCGTSLCSWKTDADAPETRRLRAPSGCTVLRHWLRDNVAIAGANGEEPCFIDVATGVVEKTLPFIAGSLLFPKRGDTFLTAFATARSVRVEVWSASKAQRVRSLATVDDEGTPAVPMATPSLSPDGHHAVALTAARQLTWWDTSTGKVVRRLTLPVDVGRAEYLRDGWVLLVHASGNSFDLAHADSPVVRSALQTPETTYHTIELTPDGKGFAAGIQDRVQVWDLTSGAPSHSLYDEEAMGRTWLLRFSSDGKHLGVLHARGVRVWELASNRVVYRTTPEQGQRITAIAFDGQGRLVTTRSVYPPEPKAGVKSGEVTIIELADPKAKQVGFSVGPHTAVQISAHAERVAIAPPGRGVRVFDTLRASLVREVPVAGTWSLSPDGAWIAYVGVASKAKSTDTSLQVVRVSDGKEWVIEKVPTPAGPLAWRPDGALFAASIVRNDGGQDVVMIDPGSRAVVTRTQLGVPPDAYYLTLMHDGARLLTRYRQGGMSFHRMSDGAPLVTLGFMDDGETWLAWTEPGTFDMGGPLADRLIGCRVGARVLPFALCATEFRKPGLLGRALGP